MLSRTANELYWMARHIERAENTARMLDITSRMLLLPYHIMRITWAELWAIPLITTGLTTPYYERSGASRNVLNSSVIAATLPIRAACTGP